MAAICEHGLLTLSHAFAEIRFVGVGRVKTDLGLTFAASGDLDAITKATWSTCNTSPVAGSVLMQTI